MTESVASVRAGGSDDSPRPILKWAGGKTQMLTHLVKVAPRRYERYIEPFVGGGALFFALCPERAVIADSNPELINVYLAVRDNVREVVRILKAFGHSEEDFYRIRGLDFEALTPEFGAARTIYLNRTCFNGLYRVNRQGRFNVPFGRYRNPVICRQRDLERASETLAGVDIRLGDYKDVLQATARAGDFVFLDPPYIPVSQYSDFKRYTRIQFEESDHVELAREVDRLHGLGCHVVLTNSNHPLVHDMYAKYGITVHGTKRCISATPSSRTGEDVIVVAEGCAAA